MPIRGYRIRRVQVKNERPTASEPPDAIQLPASDETIQHFIHVSTEMLAPANRQRVHITELQDLRNIEGRNRAFCLQVIRILHIEGIAIEATTKPGNAVVCCGSVIDRLGHCVSDQELKTLRE